MVIEKRIGRDYREKKADRKMTVQHAAYIYVYLYLYDITIGWTYRCPYRGLRTVKTYQIRCAVCYAYACRGDV